MQRKVFWDITSCQLIIDYRRFGGITGGVRKFLRKSVINYQSTSFHTPEHFNISSERCVYTPGFGNLFTCPNLENCVCSNFTKYVETFIRGNALNWVSHMNMNLGIARTVIGITIIPGILVTRCWF